MIQDTLSNPPDSQYRWLEQQGEAFGAPGMEPRWTSSVKDAVGTAYSASSRIWYTVSHGIINEIYHPTIDHPQTRDMELLITDGSGFVHEEKRDLIHDFEYIHADALGVRYFSRDREGRYQLVKEIICDPHHSVVLCTSASKPAPTAAKTSSTASRSTFSAPLTWMAEAPATAPAPSMSPAAKSSSPGKTAGPSRSPPIAVSPASPAASSATRDGWRDLTDNFHMDWQFGSATNGNLALTGELDLHGSREFTLGLGIGDSFHSALSKTMGALSQPFPQHAARFLEQWQRAASPQVLAAKSGDGGKLMQTSHNVLLAHEDKTYSGAFVASASIPWGQAKGDDDLGGYHLVWTRDMVQTASALLACGRVDTARRALVYLACTQRPDGIFRPELLDRRPPLLDRRSTRRSRLPPHPDVAHLESWRSRQLGRLPLRRARRRLPRPQRPHHPPGALGRKLRLLALDPRRRHRRAYLRRRNRP